MDLFEKYEYINFREIDDLVQLHPVLTKEACERQIILIDSLNNLHGGFFVFRKICFSMPMMFPLVLIFFIPGMGVIGPVVYQWVARNRFRFVKKPT